MKKILFVLVACLSVLLSKAQAPQTLYSVPDISTMQSYTGYANRIYVVSSNEDYVQCVSCTVDGSSVYSGAGGRKWKKVVATSATDTALINTLIGDSILQKMDTAYVSSSTTADTIIGEKGNTRFVISIIDSKQGVIYGCIVSYVSGLTYHVSPGAYKIGPTRYFTTGGDVTLPAADATFGTIDAIALDSTGPIVIPGTPSVNPGTPNITPDQWLLAYYNVGASATTPTGVSTILVYDENTEWTFAATGFTADANSTTSPFHGSKDIYISAGSSGNYFSLTDTTTHSSTDYTNLTFHVLLGSALNNKSGLSVQFFNGASNVTGQINLNATNGFSKSITGSYQTVTISIPSANFSSSSFNKIRFIYTGNSFVTFRVDYVVLQAGVSGGGGSTFTQVQSNYTQSDNTQPDYIKNKPVIYTQAQVDSIIQATKDSLKDTIKVKYPIMASADTIYLKKDSLPKLDYAAPSRDTSTWDNQTLVDKEFLQDRINTVTATGITRAELADTSVLKLNISDTASMLSPYLRSIDTTGMRLQPIAGTNMTITGTYPNLTFNASGGSVSGLYQDVPATSEGQTVFTFTTIPTDANKYSITVWGVVVPKSQYTADTVAKTITFTTGVQNGADVIIQGVQ